MRTRIFRLASALSLLVGAQLLLGCQKKCQAPVEQAFTNLSQTEWRIVNSTNPGFKGLDNFTFLTMRFNRDFTGEVYFVNLNQKSETPDKIFKWKADPRTQQLATAYTDAPAEDADPEAEAPPESTEANLINYKYTLGRELNLRETKTGYTYRLVPFDESFNGGIIEPDSNCTF